MFSFFRRQGKKQQGGGNSKKSKKQQGEFEYLNDIQCVPVERYQLDLSKPFNNENKAPSKPQLSPLIMGNSESTKKCSTESLDAGYQSDSPTKHNNNNVNSKNSEFRWESSTPHRIPSDSSNTTPSPPLNEVMTMLKNVGPRCDVSSLSRAKEIFLKTQAVSLTTSAPSNSINTSPQPPLAVPEDTDSCDSQTDVKSSYKGAHLDDTSTIRRINTENCDFSNRDSIRFADSDEGNVEDDERPKPVPYRQFSQSSSLCSNEDDDDAFQEAESKEDDSLSTHNNLQVPNITITESSDSEKEDDSDDDLQPEYYVMEQHYDRTYPTFLYDITEVEEPFSDASDVDASGYNDDRRNFVQEPKIQEQIIKSLKCELETKDSENMQLKGKVNDLQRDVLNKTWGMDRLHAELASFETEADCVRKKLLKVEDDLIKYKTKNIELNEELLKNLEKESDTKFVNELQSEVEGLKLLIKNLQKELDQAQCEKKRLQTKLSEIETEKNDRLKTVEMALSEALKQKQKLQAHFDTEYEKLRTLNTDREQHMVEDFEWKLREVEINCKRKIEEKDKANEEKIKLIKKQLEAEIVQLKEQLKKIEKLKSYEAEAIQLRGLTQEQERSLRMATRTADQLHSNQRCLDEEIDKLRSTLEKERTHLATVQGIHSREIAEKDRKYSFKLEQQRNEINAEWEDKHRRELTRVKLEVEKQHKDEKWTLLDDAKSKAEQQLKENDEMWNKKLAECKKELETLDQKLIEKERLYREELVKLQTNSDRDMLELRRKLDRMDLRYQEQLEKKQEEHEKEIENLKEEHEKKIQLAEQNWAQQVSSTRATLELVKEQLQREAETQTEAINKKYMMQLEQQHERLVQEKEDAVAEMQEKCSKEMCELQNQLNEELTAQKHKEIEMFQVITDLKQQLADKTRDTSTLQETNHTLQDIIDDLKEKATIYNKLREEAEKTLKNREAEQAETLTKIRERYENEIVQLQLKLSTFEKSVANSSEKESVPETQASNTEDYNNHSNQSKSSRRRNRGRHRNNQQKNQQRPQLTHQFSL